MGVDGGGGREKDKEKVKEKEREEEQDGMSVHSPCKAPPSSASSLPKVSVNSLSVCIHRHFVLYGLMEFLRRRFDRHFAPDEVLQLLDRFYNLDMLKPDDEEMEILNHEEDFCLPQSYFDKEES
ncbi:Chromatin modification-like protein [Citrus sinensis]|nr:Chromatin modification-like protein [Citrus sinensis]